MLDDNIDDSFKVSNSLTLQGWNQSMEIMEILDQITTTYGCPMPNALLQNDMLFAAHTCLPTRPRHCSGASKIAKRYNSSAKTNTPPRNS
jgi:hypothetical protein